MVKVKTKRQYCSPYSCKNKDKLALRLYGEIRRYPFPYQALLRLLPFSRCAVKGICYIF